LLFEDFIGGNLMIMVVFGIKASFGTYAFGSRDF
jgi:hypothetical protein